MQRSLPSRLQTRECAEHPFLGQTHVFIDASLFYKHSQVSHEGFFVERAGHRRVFNKQRECCLQRGQVASLPIKPLL